MLTCLEQVYLHQILLLLPVMEPSPCWSGVEQHVLRQV